MTNSAVAPRHLDRRISAHLAYISHLPQKHTICFPDDMACRYHDSLSGYQICFGHRLSFAAWIGQLNKLLLIHHFFLNGVLDASERAIKSWLTFGVVQGFACLLARHGMAYGCNPFWKMWYLFDMWYPSSFFSHHLIECGGYGLREWSGGVEGAVY